MVDGIHIVFPLKSFEQYKKKVPFLHWVTPINLETGEIKYSQKDKKGRYQFITIDHTAQYNELKITVSEVKREFKTGHLGKTVEFRLTIKGSLHKNHLEHNAGQFSFTDLQEQLTIIENVLHLPLKKGVIRSIEIGLNIEPPFPPSELLNGVLAYKGGHFYHYNPKELGGFFALAQFDIKIYNKGLQSGLTEKGVIRLELHYKKMQPLKKYRIKNLADLRNKETVYQLFTELQRIWHEVILIDPCLLVNKGIKPSEKEFINEIQIRGYWENLYRTHSRQTRLEKKDRLRKLNVTHGNDLHGQITQLITQTWENLFTERVTFLPGVKTEIDREGDELTIKIKGKNVIRFKRQCLTCARDITHQKGSSKFCSERLYGKAAKKCRNQNSNPRNNRIRKIERIEKRGVLFDIKPYLVPPIGLGSFPRHVMRFRSTAENR